MLVGQIWNTFRNIRKCKRNSCEPSKNQKQKESSNFRRMQIIEENISFYKFQISSLHISQIYENL